MKPESSARAGFYDQIFKLGHDEWIFAFGNQLLQMGETGHDEESIKTFIANETFMPRILANVTDSQQFNQEACDLLLSAMKYGKII